MANTAGVRVALGLAVLFVLAGCGATKTATVERTVTVVRTATVHVPAKTATTSTTTAAASACTGRQLSGAFAEVPGSAGAGQITYRLRLTNTSGSACFVSGLPQVQLIGTTGAALPTTPSASPGAGGGARVSLAHGATATADARFSPDVNGQGDSTTPGPCQPTATVLRVTAPGGGTVDVPVQPPTSVCSRGTLRLSPYAAAAP